jgi:putative tryptophan/tyrosine transport system substrate-binding protein
MFNMRRREFITLLGGAGAAWPLGARAQAPHPIRIGTLHVYSPPDPWLEALRQGLRDFGYAEGRNIQFEERWAEGRNDRLDGLAQELIDSKVDILVVMMGPALVAARRKTSTVPIVMAVSGDGVGTAGVASLARPGGNVTGVTLMSPDLVGLRLALLREAAPAAKRIAVLYSAAEPPTERELRETEAAAQTLGVTLQPVEASNVDALNQAFSNAIAGGADALLTFPHVFAFFHRRRIAELAAQHRLPAMYGWREYAAAGGLMAYGPNVAATIRRAASFVDHIIKGANPADMPIEQPTHFELVINLKTAKALGLEVPPMLLARADEVIE